MWHAADTVVKQLTFGQILPDGSNIPVLTTFDELAEQIDFGMPTPINSGT